MQLNISSIETNITSIFQKNRLLIIPMHSLPLKHFRKICVILNLELLYKSKKIRSTKCKTFEIELSGVSLQLHRSAEMSIITESIP